MKRMQLAAASSVVLLAVSACATTSDPTDVAEAGSQAQGETSEAQSEAPRRNCRRVEVSGSRMGHRVCD